MARIKNDEYVCLAVPHIELDTSLIHTDYLPNERVVRCRDCVRAERSGRHLYCKAPMGRSGYSEVCDDDFCSRGEPREEPDA